MLAYLTYLELHVHGRRHMETLLNVIGLCAKDTHVVNMVGRMQPGRGHIIGLCSKDNHVVKIIM